MPKIARLEHLDARRLLSGENYSTELTQYNTNGDVLFVSNTNTDRGGKFTLPTVRPDGSMDIVGTGDADEITVDRVTDPTGDVDDGEYDFVHYYGQDGNLVTGSGFMDQYMTEEFLDSERDELAFLEGLRDEALAAGNPAQAAVHDEAAQGYRDRIAFGEFFKQKFLDGRFVRYTLAGVYDYFVEMSDDQAANARLTIDAGAGKDRVTIAKSLPFNAYIDGGAGSDVLISGKRRAHLTGGNGNDRLISRSIRGGTLAGGKGADRYYNQASGSEIEVLARNDGDKVVTDTKQVTVKKPGVFGTEPINPTPDAEATKRGVYYIIEGDDGELNVLA